MPDPINFAGYLGQAQQLVPDFAEETLRRQLGALQTQQIAAQTRAADADTRFRDFQTQQGLRATTQQQIFSDDFEAAIATGDPRQIARVIARNPQFADAAKATWDRLDSRVRDADLRDMGQVYAAANNGRYDIAAETLRRRIQADKAADGQADPNDEQILELLESSDPAEQKRGAGMVGAGVAALTGPEKFASTYGALNEGNSGFTLSPGAKRFDKDGKLIAEAPFAPRTISVGDGETVVEYDPNSGGGDPASGGVAGSRGDVSRLINTDAGGGYVPDSVRTLGQFVAFGRDLNKRGAKSSSAGTYQINGSTMAEFGPKALGADWKNAPFNAETQDRVGREIFEWAKQQSNPAAALQGRWVALNRAEASRLVQGNWEQARGLIAQKESGGGAGASAGQAGGPRVIARGRPKEGYQMLTPEETAAAGLDPNVRYQRGPNGQITALGGQSKAQLKPWPAPALQSRASNRAALRNIDAAISLLNPNNNSAEAKRARNSIGAGTGFLGDRFTQWNNPEGTDFRARVGQIGGLIIKDVSGAAVSLSEDQRLAKWVPLVTDSPPVARAKLNNLQRELRQRDQALDDTYTPDQGFRPFSSGGSAGGIATVRSVQEAQRLAPGTLYRAPDGKVRRR